MKELIQKLLLVTVGVISIAIAGTNNEYNLYSDNSLKSKIISNINDENQNEFIHFYTDKEGKWAKYANSNTGEVGWVDLEEIQKQKKENIKNFLIRDIDERINFYNEKLSSLLKIKTKISKADYKELQQYLYFGNYQSNNFNMLNINMLIE